MGYCDYDFAGDVDGRRSNIGYALTLYKNLVRWKSNLQVAVSRSATESEYIACTKAINERLCMDQRIGGHVRSVSGSCDNDVL